MALLIHTPETIKDGLEQTCTNCSLTVSLTCYMALGLAAIQTTVSQHFYVRKALEAIWNKALRGIQIIFCFLTFVLDMLRNFLYSRLPRLFKKGENSPNHTLTRAFLLVGC
jgi:hypothetical protein